MIAKFLSGILFILVLTLSCKEDNDNSGIPRPNEVNTLKHDGLNRTYLLHVPPTYNESEATPLVIMLHGYTGTSIGQEQYTGFSINADAEGFIVVYPDGLKYPWNESNPQAWNAGAIYEQWTGGTDDVGFIKKIIEEMRTHYNIDGNRIFATGHSNGAFMSYRLAYELSDVFAAIAPVSGQMVFTPIMGPENKISILHLHALNDPTVLYNGRTNVDLSHKSVDTVLSHWALWYGCTEEPDTIVKNTDYIVKTWPCTGNISITSYVLTSGGHSWFTAENSGLMANDVILEFFNSHPKSTE
jgi:polyhydroxybutyrate depolymerase